MSSDEYSCIKLVEETVHVALPMSYCANPLIGVKEYLDNWKCKYIQLLEGLVVDYNKLSFVTPLGKIIDDQAYVHYDVTAEFSIFMPTPGSLLKGVVNRISREHIGCVVHNSINASISISEDISVDIWNHIVIDSTILFEVIYVDINKKVIHVEGKLTNESVELTQTLFPQQKSKHLFFDGNEDTGEESTSQVNDSTFLPEQVSSPKKRKHRRDRVEYNSNYDDGEKQNSFNASPMFNSTPYSNKPKKRKRHKNYSDETLDSQASCSTVSYEQINTPRELLTTYKKFSTKSSYSETPMFSNSDNEVSKKKKKRKKSESREKNAERSTFRTSVVDSETYAHKKHKKHKKKS